jgi:uncharacterized protein (DUF2062 family)
LRAIWWPQRWVRLSAIRFRFRLSGRSTLKLGNLLIGVPHDAAHRHVDLRSLLTHLDVGQLWDPVIKPMLIGSIPPGLFAAIAFYVFTYWGVTPLSDPQKVETGSARKARIQELAAARR